MTAELSQHSAQTLQTGLEALARCADAHDQAEATAIIRTLARKLTGADGVAVVLRKDDRVYYVDEDAIAPLWKGHDYPIGACISGWAILHRQTIAIPDIHLDTRIPLVAYRPTFVQSLAVAPIRAANPIGALGAYWSVKRMPTPQELAGLELVAKIAAPALETALVRAELLAAIAGPVPEPLADVAAA